MQWLSTLGIAIPVAAILLVYLLLHADDSDREDEG